MKQLKAQDEFVVGKHSIGWVSPSFMDQFKNEVIAPRPMPTMQTLPRDMSDAEIEKELQVGLCTLGEVLTFLDEAPQECKGGHWNLFYFPSLVVYVYWNSGYAKWRVSTWDRDGSQWRAGSRVLSPATDSGKLSTKTLGTSDPLPAVLVINGVEYKRV